MKRKKRRETQRRLLLGALALSWAAGAAGQGRGAVQVLKGGQMIDPLRAPGLPGFQRTWQESAAQATFSEALALDAPAHGVACTEGPAPEGLLCPPQGGGLDHVAAGIGLRHRDRGVISLRGAPQGASPVAAYLYLGLIDAAGPDPLALTFRGELVQAHPVGSTDSPCWLGETARFHLLRASVSHLLYPELNGDYPLGGVPTSRFLGDDPWSTAEDQPPLAEGASLVVVYSHPSLPQSSRVLLHEGPAALSTHLLVDNPMSLPPQPVFEYRHTRIGADGQTHRDGQLTSRVATLLGDGAGTWIYARGPGSPLDPGSDWRGRDGGPFTQLWDTQTQDVDLGGGSHSAESTSYEVFYFAADGLVGGSACSPPPVPDPYGFEPVFARDTLVDCVAVALHALTTR